MKISSLCTVLLSLMLASCSSIRAVQPVNSQAQPQQTAKQTIPNSPHATPMKVSLYSTAVNSDEGYTIIGSTSVSEYNSAGNKRQEATIHDAMRSAAVSMGGDAVINIKRNNKIVSGTVISYEPKITV